MAVEVTPAGSTCDTWNEVEIQSQGILDGILDLFSSGFSFDGLLGTEEKATNDYPGALNQGWEHYYEWANKDHGAWVDAFNQAECQRLRESERWLTYYRDVYLKDNAWWKKLIMFAVNGVQLWALYRQFRQQKEIADNTYNIANRIQNIAEGMHQFYESVYQPQETALSKQINDYFNGTTSCVEYGIADQFANNTQRAFARSRADLVKCSGSFCGAFSQSTQKEWELEASKALGNARVGGLRYAELLKESKDSLYMELRMKFIQIGRNASIEGQNGIVNAFGTFSNFGADPGAALGQLLGTFSNTLGSMISSPVSPNGTTTNGMQSNTLPPYMTRVTQSGDVQVGKTNVNTNNRSF